MELNKKIICRLYSKHILFVGNEVGRKPPSFQDAALVAQAILDSGYEFSSGKIIYNKFKWVYFKYSSLQKSYKITLFFFNILPMLKQYAVKKEWQ